MIITTTPSVDGRKIEKYLGVVCGEVISGVNFVKDFAAGLTNFFGGRSGSYENELIDAREQALHELEQRALMLWAQMRLSALILTMKCSDRAEICLWHPSAEQP